MAIKLTTLGELSQTPQAVTPSLQQTNIPKLVTTGNLTNPARSKALSEQQAVKYAMKMGMSDSSRGLQQIYAKLTKKSSLLDTLKDKDEKLKAIFENPEYGDKAFQSYLGSAIALDPVGWIPLAGWIKKI